jgi:hypothetical protein
VEAQHPAGADVDRRVVLRSPAAVGAIMSVPVMDASEQPELGPEYEPPNKNRTYVEVPDVFAVARWRRDADVGTICRCILGTLKYEPHAADVTPLRRALEGVIDEEREGAAPCVDAAMSDYADWLAQNPWPDLQDFVRKHGDYRRMPPEIWATFDRASQLNMMRNGVFRLVRPEEWEAYDAAVAAWQAKRKARYGRGY